MCKTALCNTCLLVFFKCVCSKEISLYCKFWPRPYSFIVCPEWSVQLSSYPAFMAIQASLLRGGLRDHSKACGGKKIDCVFRGGSVVVFCLIPLRRGLKDDMRQRSKPHNFSSVNLCVCLSGSNCFSLLFHALLLWPERDIAVSYLKLACIKFLNRLLHCVFWSHFSSKCIPLACLLQDMPSPVR